MATGLRERKKQQTRELIAETARRLFTERGFERVSVAEIARVADVSEKTVFNYFPTKEDLVYWRLESFEEELLETIRGRAAGESLLAREQQIFQGYTASLAALIAEETGARPDDVEPWVAANAMMGVHRRLIDFTRERIVAGARHPELAAEVLAQADRGLALLE